MSEFKIWRCPKGHILGQVERNGRGVQQLYIYRTAIDLDEMDGETPEIIAIAGDGVDIVDVSCSICWTVRTWVPSKAALERMIKKYFKEIGHISD